MTPLAFLRLPETARLIARAARCAGTPLSVHPFVGGREGLRALGHGHCGVCARVAQCDGGNAACRRSREPVSQEVLRRGIPLPFLCHMGLACFSTPLPDAAPGWVITFGPYCPVEGAEALEDDAVNGLAALGMEADETFRDAVAEVSVLPAACVPGIAEWLADAIELLWRENQSATMPPTEATDAVPRKAKKKPPLPSKDPYDAGTITALLLGGEQSEARRHFRGVLAESESGARVKIAVQRARAVALAAAVLEAAERNRADTAACWDRFAEFVAGAGAARSEDAIIDAGMRLLGVLKRKAVRAPESKLGYVELNRILNEHLLDGITLEEVARQLGQTPTAITHRLQRRFNMSFSQYKGRLQIDKAKEILRRTSLSVTAVGKRIGIGDTSNFCKQFSKFEGMTPLEYREKFGRNR